MIKRMTLVFCVLFIIVLTASACSNNEVVYKLDSILVVINPTTNQIKINYGIEDFEDFEEKYPGRIDHLGRKITIKNNKELLFIGEATKDIDGNVSIYEIQTLTYISFVEADFNNLFLVATIYKEDIYIEGHDEIINDTHTQIIYIFKKGK